MTSYSRPQIIGLAVLIGLVLAGTVVYLAKSGVTQISSGPVKLIQPGGASAEAVTPSEPEKPRTVSVHVAGKVAKPGVYELEPGGRVRDAIEAAGGPSGNADLETINLAEKLQDGQQIYVAPKGQVPPPVVSVVRGGDSSSGKRAGSESKGGGSGVQKYKNPGDGTVSINGADANDLQHLVGVGPAMAQRIIDYRKEHGGFKSVDELEEVKGIGPKTLAKMKPFVKL
jgi:competence protein ComEA